MTISAEAVGYDVEHLAAFHDLLPAIAHALDVRDIFQHLSTVATRIVPHDEANLALLTEDGTQFRLYASTRDGVPEVVCRGKDCPIGEAAYPSPSPLAFLDLFFHFINAVGRQPVGAAREWGRGSGPGRT